MSRNAELYTPDPRDDNWQLKARMRMSPVPYSFSRFETGQARHGDHTAVAIPSMPVRNTLSDNWIAEGVLNPRSDSQVFYRDTLGPICTSLKRTVGWQG